jgi:hypothetical protein
MMAPGADRRNDEGPRQFPDPDQANGSSPEILRPGPRRRHIEQERTPASTIAGKRVLVAYAQPRQKTA